MNTVPITIRRRPQRRRGYTLMEVLLAVGIFAIGFAMVATIFPAALLLQKKTVDAVNGQQMARNSEAHILGRGIIAIDIRDEMNTWWGSGTGTWDDSQTVLPIPEPVLSPDGGSSPVSGITQWTLRDRSYPASLDDPLHRKFYWVPMIKDNDPVVGSQSFILYLFILQKHADQYDKSIGVWANPNDQNDVPGVYSINLIAPFPTVAADPTRMNFRNQDFDNNGINDPGLDSAQLLVSIGDKVLDNNGTVHEVLAADADGINVSGLVLDNPNPVVRIWLGHPGWDRGGEPETQSAIVDIIQLVEPFN